jgi:hypothetical protein
MPCDPKYNCGQVLPSSCVPYTGSDLTVLDNPTDLSCDANINDVIKILDTKIKTLMDSNDLTSLDEKCFDFDPDTVTNVELHQLEIDKLCLLEANLTALTEQFNELNIGSLPLTLNLLCMAPAASACAISPNTYTLLSILNTLIAKICDHETRITNLE